MDKEMPSSSSAIDFEARRASTKQDVQDDLTNIAVKLNQLKAEENTVLSLSARDQIVIFTYIGNKFPVCEPLSWSSMPAPIVTWTDRNYAEFAKKYCRWEISALEGDLTSTLEIAFKTELEERTTTEMTDFIKRLVKFIDSYPHVDYPSYSLYFAFMEHVFLDHGFSQKLWDKAIEAIINTRLKWKSFNKSSSRRENMTSFLVSPTVMNLSKIRSKAIEELNHLTDPAHAATRSLLERLLRNNQ